MKYVAKGKVNKIVLGEKEVVKIADGWTLSSFEYRPETVQCGDDVQQLYLVISKDDFDKHALLKPHHKRKKRKANGIHSK